MNHWNADKMYKEKARQELHKNATSYTKQILEATSHETTVVWPHDIHVDIYTYTYTYICTYIYTCTLG